MSKKGSNPPPPAGSVRPPPPPSPPISRGWGGYDGPLNLPEFLRRPLVHGEVCDHGSLRRSCEICERDDEIASLRDALKLKTAGDDFAHRLAVMLECALLDRPGTWDDGHALLAEYRAACAMTGEPPTFMGEPVWAPARGNRRE